MSPVRQATVSLTRLTKRRAEPADLLGPGGLADETDRGRRASSDEALRWALELLRSRHFRKDQPPAHP